LDGAGNDDTGRILGLSFRDIDALGGFANEEQFLSGGGA
jgi:hypothetical protein